VQRLLKEEVDKGRCDEHDGKAKKGTVKAGDDTMRRGRARDCAADGRQRRTEEQAIPSGPRQPLAEPTPHARPGTHGLFVPHDPASEWMSLQAAGLYLGVTEGRLRKLVARRGAVLPGRPWLSHLLLAARA
jgi:hypothetical protein